MQLSPRLSSGWAKISTFSSNNQDSNGIDGFVILDGEGSEIIQAGWYYSVGWTNNEVESFALWDTL